MSPHLSLMVDLSPSHQESLDCLYMAPVGSYSQRDRVWRILEDTWRKEEGCKRKLLTSKLPAGTNM